MKWLYSLEASCRRYSQGQLIKHRDFLDDNHFYIKTLSLKDIFCDQNCELFNIYTCVKSVMTLNNIFLTLTFDLSSRAEIKVFPIPSFLPAFILSIVLLDSSEQSSRWNEMHEAIWIIQLFGYGLLACYAGRGERNEDLKCIESTHYWTDMRRKW